MTPPPPQPTYVLGPYSRLPSKPKKEKKKKKKPVPGRPLTRSDVVSSIVNDTTPLPPPAATAEEDARLLRDYPYVEGPIKMDYGTNCK